MKIRPVTFPEPSRNPESERQFRRALERWVLETASIMNQAATGWGAPTGTATRTTFATFAGQTISNPPTQAEVQAIDNHVKVLSERMKALVDDLTVLGDLEP